MRKSSNGFVIGGAVIGLFIIGFFVWFLLCVTSIGQGHVGIVFSRMGGVQAEPLGQGWHTVGITENVTEYPVSTETAKEALNIATKDGKVVTAEASYSFKFDIKQVPLLFDKFRGREMEYIRDNYMKERLTAMVQQVTSTYGVLEVYGDKRGELNDKVFKSFKEELGKVGIIVETFNFSKITPDPETQKTIQQLVDQQLVLEKTKLEKDNAEILAQKQKIEAQGNADAAIIKAKGEAEANQVLSNSVTDKLLEQQRIAKWNGAYPYSMGGSGAILNVPAPVLPGEKK